MFQTHIIHIHVGTRIVQLLHRYFTFLVGICTQKTFIFCQQQYIPVFGCLNLNNLDVLRIFFYIIIDSMETLVSFIEQVEFAVDGLNPQKTIFIFHDTLNLTWWNVGGIKTVMIIIGAEFASIETT